MTKIVISRDRKLLLINGVRCEATGAVNDCIECRVMLAARVLALGDPEEHRRVCGLCCNDGHCHGMVTVAAEAT